MAQQNLHRSQVLRALVDQRRFGAANRMRAVSRRIESDFPHPSVDHARVLARREMCALTQTAWEQVIPRPEPSFGHPGADTLASLLSESRTERVGQFSAARQWRGIAPGRLAQRR